MFGPDVEFTLPGSFPRVGGSIRRSAGRFVGRDESVLLMASSVRLDVPKRLPTGNIVWCRRMSLAPSRTPSWPAARSADDLAETVTCAK